MEQTHVCNEPCIIISGKEIVNNEDSKRKNFERLFAYKNDRPIDTISGTVELLVSVANSLSVQCGTRATAQKQTSTELGEELVSLKTQFDFMNKFLPKIADELVKITESQAVLDQKVQENTQNQNKISAQTMETMSNNQNQNHTSLDILETKSTKITETQNEIAAQTMETMSNNQNQNHTSLDILETKLTKITETVETITNIQNKINTSLVESLIRFEEFRSALVQIRDSCEKTNNLIWMLLPFIVEHDPEELSKISAWLYPIPIEDKYSVLLGKIKERHETEAGLAHCFGTTCYCKI